MTRQDDDAVVTIETGQVTVRGTPEEIDQFVGAAGLYGQVPNPPPMSKDDDHVMTGVYIGLGLLVAAGAGYLAWRYLLSDEQKQKAINSTKDMIADGATKAKRTVRDVRGKVHL